MSVHGWVDVWLVDGWVGILVARWVAKWLGGSLGWVGWWPGGWLGWVVAGGWVFRVSVGLCEEYVRRM